MYVLWINVWIAVRNVYDDVNNANVIYNICSLLEVFRSSLLSSTKTNWDEDCYVSLIETKNTQQYKIHWKYFMIKLNKPIKTTIVKGTIDRALIDECKFVYTACPTISLTLSWRRQLWSRANQWIGFNVIGSSVMEELIGKIGLIKNALREHANKNLYKLFVIIIKKNKFTKEYI